MDCTFLIESRVHAKQGPLDLSPQQGVTFSKDFVRNNQQLFVAVSMALLNGVLDAEGCVDNDVQECLDAGIRNRKTRESGLFYDGKPENRIAAQVLEGFEARLADFRKESATWQWFPRVKDADELKMFAFLRSLAASHNNGRRKSRAFIHFLYGLASQHLPPEGELGESIAAAAATSLIQP